MDIVFLILKILFVLLQVCLLLIVFAVLAILFTKLKYQLKVNTVYESLEDKNSKANINVVFRATYLFSIIKLFVDRKDDKIKILVKVFNKKVFKTQINPDELNEALDEAEEEKREKLKKAKKYADEKLNIEDDKNDIDIVDTIDKIDELDEAIDQKLEKVIVEDIEGNTNDTSYASNTSNTSNTSTTNNASNTSKTKTSNTKKKKTKEEIQDENELNQAKSFIKSIKKSREIKLANKLENLDEEEVEKASEMAIYIKKYVKNVHNIKKLFHATIQAIKNISPKKFILRLNIGFADPSKTGQLMGLLYMIKGMTNLDISVNGEFEKEIKPDVFCYSNGSFSVFDIIKPFGFFIGDLTKEFVSIKYKNVIAKIKKLLTKLKKDKGE